MKRSFSVFLFSALDRLDIQKLVFHWFLSALRGNNRTYFRYKLFSALGGKFPQC